MTKAQKLQKVQTVKELVDLISLRNHIYNLVNGHRTNLVTR